MLGVELLHLQQLREPEHDVQRRAQFVAHPREKLALGSRRSSCDVTCLDERGLQLDAIAHIAEDRDCRSRRAVAAQQRLPVPFKGYEAAACMTNPHADGEILGGTRDDRADGVEKSRSVLVMRELTEFLSDEVCRLHSGA